MQSEALIRALDVCLQQIQRGSTLEQVLETYPEWQKELVQPLEAAQALNAYARNLNVSLEAQAANREIFIQHAQNFHAREQIYAGAHRRRHRTLATASILGLVTLFILITIFSGRALPGNVLYPVKELFRQMRFATTRNEAQKLDLSFALES